MVIDSGCILAHTFILYHWKVDFGNQVAGSDTFFGDRSLVTNIPYFQTINICVKYLSGKKTA